MKLLVEQEHIRGVAERMKILLFNDNPVVRKLVALSAQKTKDELSVVWSIDEIGEGDYDLLIIDDAMYSDELFLSLKEVVTYKSTLLMATRGQSAPLGFDNVIHKPFLPTDLVDMFVQIEKKVTSQAKQENTVEPTENLEESVYAINLEDELPELSLGEEGLNLEEIESFDLGDLEGEIDLSGDDLEEFDMLEEEAPQTTILDQEEVQEVQNLLDDAENDDWNVEEGIEVKPIEETFDALEQEAGEDAAGNDSFEDMGLDELLEEVKSNEPNDDDLELSAFEENELLDEEEFSFDDEPMNEPTEPSEEDAFDEALTLDETLEDDLALDGLNDTLIEEAGLGDLESQIEDAMSNLSPETLESELELGDLDLEVDDSLLEELELPDIEDDAMMDIGEGDPFDALDEKALKRAIGEEIEEENEEAEAESEEFLDETEEESEPIEESISSPVSCDDEVKPSHAEGVEALQALLKALSNEEVAKSLKGLNISININFGKDA